MPKNCASRAKSAGIGSNEFTELNYNAGIMFEKPGVVGPASKFFAGVNTVLEHPDAYDHFSVKGNTGLSYDLDRQQTAPRKSCSTIRR